ncbi:MAG: response regulator transcription factor [bacterium]
MSTAESHGSGNNTRGVLIVDFHPIVRLGLANLVNGSEGLRVCGEAETAHETMETIKALRPDLIILDISLKGINGIDLIERINRQYPTLPILVFSKFDEEFYAERALRAGARGYIMKHTPLKGILMAIVCVLNGEIYLSNKIALKIMNKSICSHTNGCASPFELLSNRELEVFRLIGKGCGTRTIAERLFISARTVEAYRAHIKDKLKLKSGDELLQQAIHWMKSER